MNGLKNLVTKRRTERQAVIFLQQRIYNRKEVRFMHNFRKSKRMRDFDVILRKNGYTPTRCKGSHFVYINRTTHRIMPVNKDLNDMVRQRLIKEYNLEV